MEMTEKAVDQRRNAGKARSEKKAAASRENGKKGGRPRKIRDVEEAKPATE